MGEYKRLVLLLFLFFSMSRVNAAACDNALKVDYQNRATNISYTYTYNDSNNTFNILFTNITDGLFLMDMNNMKEYRNNAEITVYNAIPGNRYRFGVFTSDDNPCKHSSVYNIYVSLPFYNPYYNDALCDGINNYKYCKKFVKKNITYDEFKENVVNYRNSLEQSSGIKDDDVIKPTLLEKIFNSILDLYIKYYFVILPSIIVITIIIIIRESNKDKLF